MTSSLTASDALDRFSTALSSLLETAIRRVFGAGVDDCAFGPFSCADLGVTLCFLLAALLLHILAAVIIRRRATPPGAAATAATAGKGMRRHLFGALGRPLYVVIWIYGGYFALTPLLLKLKPDVGLNDVHDFLGSVLNLGVFAALFWFIFRLTRVLEARLAVWASRGGSKMDGLFVPLLGKSLRIIIPVAGIMFALPLLNLPPDYAGLVAKGTSILLIAALAIILVQLVDTGEKAVLARFDITAADNLRARKVYTQVHVITQVIYVVIGLFTVATILMLFQEVRHVGASLLASAGIVGIIAGVAAQKPLANMFAGFQIALAQPIRLDDVVIVEGEWGRIEEITLSFVVVHIWDDRRLVLPLTYFVEKPFQNWTRSSAVLLGSVFVWVDYSFPVEDGRRALKDIIEASPLWDKRFWNLQVSDASERTMQLRVLATAADSSKAWDLRCEIREKFIAYIQDKHPASLPKLRAQMQGGDSAAPLPS
jgi:hypothetical protein